MDMRFIPKDAAKCISPESFVTTKSAHDIIYATSFSVVLPINEVIKISSVISSYALEDSMSFPTKKTL